MSYLVGPIKPDAGRPFVAHLGRHYVGAHRSLSPYEQVIARNVCVLAASLIEASL